MIDLKTETERLEDGTCVMAIAGELDLYTAPGFEQALSAVLGDGAPAVIVDLSDCEFIDSTALGILVAATKRLGRRRSISIVTADRNIRKIFAITGLEEVFAFHSTRAGATNGQAHASWEDEETRTRALFREVNERIIQLARSYELAGRLTFLCECGNKECLQLTELTSAEYEFVRAHARRFLVALGHENPSLELVVSKNGQFTVVETFVGDASRIPEETDPAVFAANGMP